MSRRSLILLFSCFYPTLGYGQSNDLAISAGGIFSPNSGRSGFFCPAVVGAPCPGTGSPARGAFSVEGAVAHRLVNLHLASLHLELPVLGTPNRTAPGTSYSAIFFTPGVKVRFSLPAFSPFLSVGGGLAHFSTGSNANGSSTTGAFQIGGGVDVSTPIPLIGLRGEVREFYTGTPNFSTTQHNVFVGAGIVLKF